MYQVLNERGLLKRVITPRKWGSYWTDTGRVENHPTKGTGGRKIDT
jgi:hypothetical protein